MGRQLRFDPPGGWHHVMHRGSRKQVIYRDDLDRRGFLERLGESCERWNVEVHAFALMDNHYHLLMRCPEGHLSRAMKHVNASHAQDFNRRHGLDGHLFRGRFHSLIIGDDAYLVEVARYILRNSLVAGLVADPLLDPWNSLRFYTDPDRRSPAWLHTDVVLEYFGGDRERFRRFVDAPDSAQARDVIEAVEIGRPALGDDAFLSALLAEADEGPETAGSRQRLLRVDIAGAEEAVRSSTQQFSAARCRTLDVILLLLREQGLSLGELADRYGFVSTATVAARVRRLRLRIERDPRLSAQIDHCRRRLSMRAA